MIQNIILCGFMGSGKTEIGKILAHKLQLQFVDVDSMLEKKFIMPVSQIFSRYGETEFRKAESEFCKTLGKKQGLVIATGGGAVLSAQNVIFLKRNGIVVFLDVTPDTILKRLKNDSSRPLLQGDKEKNISELLHARLPLYKAAADYTIQADGSKEQVTTAIITALKLK